MGRRTKDRNSSKQAGELGVLWLNASPVAAAVAAVGVAIAVWRLTSSGVASGSSRGHVGRANKAAAAAEWDNFRDLILTKQRTRVSLSDEAVGYLDACLEYDPGQQECAFWRARDLMQRGSNLNTLRARDLLAGIDVNAVSTADPVDVLYLYATASETCGDEEGQMTGYTRVLELLDERGLADFVGMPNIYAGLAAVHRSRGDYVESQKAALAGIRAAKKKRGGDKSASSSSLRSVLSFASALPALHDALGAAKAAAAAGALGPAREHYAEVLQKLFPRWKHEDQVSAAQRFGLSLAELRFAADPPLTNQIGGQAAPDSGGWLQRLSSDSDRNDIIADDLICEIDVIECVSDKENFLQRYVDGNRPVLLRNFLNKDATGEEDCTGAGQEQRRHLWPWPALRNWRREKLLEQHGAVMVPIRRSSQVKAEYERARGSQLFANETTLSEFLTEMRANEQLFLASQHDRYSEKNKHGMRNGSAVSDPPYVFDPIAIGRGTEYESLLPLFADEERFSEFNLALTRANQLSIGGTNSGVSWHKHSQAYNALVFGLKRWFLSPPNHAPGNQAQSSHEWAMEREALPVEVRDAKVLTCDQQAGDVLYVPQQWWHSTLCLQESIGLAQQLGGRRGFFQLQMNMQD